MGKQDQVATGGHHGQRRSNRPGRAALLIVALVVGLLAGCSGIDGLSGDVSSLTLTSVRISEGGDLESKTLTGTVTVVADVVGAVESVAFYLDGADEPAHVADGHRQFEFELDTTVLADGEHSLLVEGRHVSGRDSKNVTSEVGFVVDNSSSDDDGTDGGTDDGTDDGSDDGTDDGSDDGSDDGDGSGPADPYAEILWQATMEDGNLAEWSEDYPGTSMTCGGEYNNGGGDSIATDEFARTGSWSAKLVVSDVNDSEGTRLRRGPCESNEHPEGLYYSSWFYVPQHYRTTAGWWNIYQFKSKADDTTGGSSVMWVLDLLDQGDGTMAFRLRDKHDGSSQYFYQDEPLSFPIAQWVHVEAFYLPSSNGDGVVTIWQNGTRIFHFEGRTTVLSNGGDARWYVNNYTRGIEPDDPAYIYVDDAAISTGRLGPNR